MDAIDAKIVECLKANARENASVIGGKVNMSVSAIIERIKKLEAAGIIKQYTLVLDKEKLGLDMTAFISVSMEHPKVIECHYITGDADFLLKICTDGSKGLEKLVNEIKCVGGVSQTKTLVVLSTDKEEYGPSASSIM